MAEPAIEVEGLTKVFGGRRGGGVVAVEDVSFTVAPGGSLAIVGESGSGKTTTARMIIGLEQPTSGRIRVGGHERKSRRAGSHERRRLGREIQIVFQDPSSSLDRRQRVRDCLDEIVRLHFDLDGAARQARVLELLSQVGLDERHADVYPLALSGGQQQRVAIARAIVNKPDILFADEPCANLDTENSRMVLNLFHEINEQMQQTIVMVSHEDWHKEYFHRIIRLRDGKVVDGGG
jgi:oligopeptide transport system ATP-binding protein